MKKKGRVRKRGREGMEKDRMDEYTMRKI
jgi:hypothetical protein